MHRPNQHLAYLISSSAFLLAIALQVGSILSNHLKDESEFAERSKNKDLSSELENTRNLLLQATANNGELGAYIAFLVVFIIIGITGPFAAYDYEHHHLWTQRILWIFLITLLGVGSVWFVVAINACAYGEQHIRCQNQNKYTANDIIGLLDWDIYTTCEKQDSLNNLITTGYCPTLGYTLAIAWITSLSGIIVAYRHTKKNKPPNKNQSQPLYKTGSLFF